MDLRLPEENSHPNGGTAAGAAEIVLIQGTPSAARLQGSVLLPVELTERGVDADLAARSELPSIGVSGAFLSVSTTTHELRSRRSTGHEVTTWPPSNRWVSTQILCQCGF